MAQKYREEVVGKRFLALRTPSPGETAVSKTDITKSDWIRGVIRASTEKEASSKDIQVLVEFEGLDWQRRDWLKIHEDFSAFLIEETLVLSLRSHPEKPNRKCWWPALTFKTIVDSFGVKKSEQQPLEFLIDQTLSFVTQENITEYKEGSRGLDAECKEAAKQWCEYQDGQRILVSTPTVLVGFRVKVYRTEGTTQWFTAVIQHYNDNNKELSLLDDTVLEEHYESAELTQIIPLDGVVEEILKGTESRITPRRRACKEKDKDKEQTGKDKESNSQSTQVNSGSNQASTSRSSKQTNHSSASQSSGSSAIRGSSGAARQSANSSSAGNTNTGNKTTSSNKKSAASEVTNNDSSTAVTGLNQTAKQSIVQLNKDTSFSNKEGAKATSPVTGDPVRAHTSVIKRAPKAEKRSRKSTTDGAEDDKKKEKQPAAKRKPASNRKSIAGETPSATTNNSIATTASSTTENVIASAQTTPIASSKTVSELDNTSDMHIKKQRALGAISDNTNISSSSVSSGQVNTPVVTPVQSSPSVVERHSTADRSSSDSVIVSAVSTVNLPPPVTSIPLGTHQPTTPISNSSVPQLRATDKLSECSTDGCSSGYSSAATNDSTISPRDKDGHRILPHPGLISSAPTLCQISNPTSTSALITSAPTPVVSTNPTALLKNQNILSSPHTAKTKSNHQHTEHNHTNPRVPGSSTSPLVVDTNKEAVTAPPVVPYRDPELLKRDAEVRKMAHTPSGPPQPPIPPSSRSLSTAASLSAIQQQAAGLPNASAAAAAMLNPQLAAQQHFNMQQLMQQYQMMEQYRQLQTMQSLNPLQQFQLLQQQQLAVAQATQQQQLLETLYNRQVRPPGLPAGNNPNWMMMPPFGGGGDKPLLSDLQREHELRALDQKERAEREAREKLEKERAEKERIEKEKERRQLIERQERARVLKESAQLAQDAVNQHFHESIRRMHTTTTPPMNPTAAAAAAMGMWGKKGLHMGAGDSLQPQDLSTNKNKDHNRMDASRQDRERDQQYQAQLLAAHGINLTEDKQKAISRQHEVFMRSIQTGSSGQQQLQHQQQSSEAKLVEEHFMKAGLSQLPPKTSEQAAAEYSLYGYQPFQHKFVSKDQLQQQLIKDEKMDSKSPKSMSSSSSRDTSKPNSKTVTPSRPPASAPHSHANYSNQLIQEGLIPNPAYTPHPSSSNSSTNNTSSSISALMNMSNIYAGVQTSAADRKDKPQTVKSEPLPFPRAANPLLPGGAPSTSMDTGEQPATLKSFKSFVEHAVTQAFLKDVEDQEKKSRAPAVSPPAASAQPVKSEKVNGTVDTDSDTLSAPSPTLSIKTESQDSKPCHPKMKLKKEWKQRHTESGGGATSTSPTSITGSGFNNSNTSNHSETTTSASETENEQQGTSKQHKAKKRKSETASSSTSNGQQKKAKNSDVSSGHYTNNANTMSRSSGSLHGSTAADQVMPAAGGDVPLNSTSSSYNQDEQDSIKQLAEIALRADRMEAIPYANKPLVRVNITTLKKTLQPFVQDGSCIEMAPKLSKCRECKMTPNQRNKKIPNIFCRFYAFRMLKFRQNGQICIAGFCDPTEAEPDDITIWLPHITTKGRHITDNDKETAKYIIANVGEEFCRLVEQEQECTSWSDNKRAWKRAVQGVREMCDVCDTTLFNTHWVCHRCGFVVCIDCYRVKRKIQSRTVSNNVCEENRRWLSCTTNKNHEADKLMLTSIIPADALKIARDLVHHVRRKHSIKVSCMCSQDKLMSPIPNTNGEHTSSDTGSSNSSPQVNGQSSGDSKLSQSYPQDVYRQTTLLSSSLDTKTLNTYSDDPLSLLADVASMAPSTNGPGLLSEVKLNGTTTAEEMDIDTGEKKPCVTLRKLLTKSQANGIVTSDKKVHDIVSTVVDPVSQTPQSGSTVSVNASTSLKSGHHQYTYYQRRSGAYLTGRAQPIPTCYLKETSMLYPDVKHSWLCDGKLLRLLDPQQPSNFKLFNQRWTLGQPIIVSNVSKAMKVDELWSPEAFSREFGHVRHDLIDCRRNEPLTGYQIKCFWDGFEDQSKRLTDATGQPLILKLKDWPTGEDFADSMPSRFHDLMSALPLPQYTQRNGPLNLAGRLPEFFVKPDLGPKMYIAYGLAKYPQSGTTNLHLDVSDAVNVMVFVAKEKELQQDVRKLIENSDCDEISRRRVTEEGETPGAIWHIFDAQDADKMRDLLNKVALELGMELEPYHDPIHDQQFYLDRKLRQRLADEYGVHGYTILQCEGDAVFIPAGAPHQVQNLNGCVKVAEDFVSPEHLHHCFNLTQEFRHLSNTHSNHEDKLQVKNIIYHAIKDAVAVLDQSDPTTT